MKRGTRPNKAIQIRNGCVGPSLVVVFSHRIFRFNNKERGLITFEGNILFTHFHEIGAPGGAPEPPRQAGINVSQAEFSSNRHDKVV